MQCFYDEDIILTEVTAAQLWIVATPIGNLGDMTFRAVEVLRQVDVIAAEDTRTSKRLLAHYDIRTPLLACHEHNEGYMADKLLSLLQEGQNIALISDAGTPLINDPGYLVVKKARKAGFIVSPLPGACSPIAALSAAGLPTHQFSYLGFVPRVGQGRQTWLESLSSMPHTVVMLESPKRLLASLHAMQPYVQGRELCVAREISKLHETFICGDIKQLIAHFEMQAPRGEIVLLVGPSVRATDVDDAAIIAYSKHDDVHDLPPSARAKAVAKKLAVPKARVYALLLQYGDE